MLHRRHILGGILALSAISKAHAQMEMPFPVGQVWVAESLDGQPFANVSQPTLRFTAEGQVQGNAGCNRYTGAASAKGSQLTLGPLAMTRMACFGAGGDNERLFAPAISSTTGWRMEQQRLVIETARGTLRFRRR